MMLLQTVLDNAPQGNAVAYAIYTLATVLIGKFGVEKWQGRRNGNRNLDTIDEQDPRRCWGRVNAELFEKTFSQTQKVHDVVTAVDKGTPLIYQRDTRDAIVAMKTELVDEIRKLRAAVEKNGG